MGNSILQASLEPTIIVEAEKWDNGSTSQHQTIDANSIVTAQQLLDEIDSPNEPEVSTNIAAPALSEEANHESAAVDTETMMAPAPVPVVPVATNICNSRWIEENKRGGIVATTHEWEWYKYENKDNIPLNEKVTENGESIFKVEMYKIGTLLWIIF